MPACRRYWSSSRTRVVLALQGHRPAAPGDHFRGGGAATHRLRRVQSCIPVAQGGHHGRHTDSPRWFTPALEIAVNSPRRAGGHGTGWGAVDRRPPSLSTGRGPVHTGRPAVAPISVRTHSAGPRIVGTFPRRTAGSGTIPKYGRLKTSVTSQSASTESISWRPRTSNDDE